jgi:glutamate racemase
MGSQAIGIFDSGVGGLTVTQQIIQLLPNENLIYFGDTARVPYGEKSPETIIKYSLENARFLMDQDIKLLVVACNTVSAYALEELQEICRIPVIGVIEPGIEKVIQTAQDNQKIAVLGTTATIKSEIYQNKIKARLPLAEIIPIACPLLVPLVEEKFMGHPAARLIIQEYLRPLKDQKISTLMLGCTHYPLLKEVIQEEIKSTVIVDSATSCAEHVCAILDTKNLRRREQSAAQRRYFVSDDPIKFQTIGKEFLGGLIESVSVAFPFSR